MSDAPIAPLHIDTQLEVHPELGVVAAAHFAKMPDGRLQMSISTPSPNGVAVVTIDRPAVEQLVRNLVAGWMVTSGTPIDLGGHDSSCPAAQMFVNPQPWKAYLCTCNPGRR